jgi:hypothetical protein
LVGEADDWGFPARGCRSFGAALTPGPIFEIHTKVTPCNTTSRQHKTVSSGRKRFLIAIWVIERTEMREALSGTTAGMVSRLVARDRGRHLAIVLGLLPHQRNRHDAAPDSMARVARLACFARRMRW